MKIDGKKSCRKAYEYVNVTRYQVIVCNEQRKVFIMPVWSVNCGQKYVVKREYIKKKADILCRNTRHNQKKNEYF